jgi:hypothetical protein
VRRQFRQIVNTKPQASGLSGKNKHSMPSKTFDASRMSAGSKAHHAPDSLAAMQLAPFVVQHMELSWNSSLLPGCRPCWPSS